MSCFPCSDLRVLEALGRALAEIRDGGVVLQDAAFHLEIVDAAGEGIRKGFEDKDRKRLGVVVFALDPSPFPAGFPVAFLACSSGWGKRRRGKSAG